MHIKGIIMSRISISKDKQARINIPKEIMKVKEWNSDTEILVTPLFLQPVSLVS